MNTNIHLTSLARDMAARAASGRPIRIGLIGCGEMGTDIVTACTRIDGLEIAAIAELSVASAGRAVQTAFQSDGHARAVTHSDAMADCINAGRVALTDDADQVVNCDLVDVVVDATGVPAVGAETGLAAMQRGKHLVMMNVEADVVIGALLAHEAHRLGVTYSLGAGDEPSSCMELVEFVSAMGYPIVAAGKGKNNPLKIDAVPDEYRDEAARRNMNVRMLVEFIDGSKTMVEMAAIANATGLVPDVPGMHGPRATLKQLSSVLVPETDGGVLGRTGVVDYSVGEGVAPGVFVVAEMRHPRVRERMADLKLGPGPYYTFHRPYHLTSLEVPLSCARAVLYGRADMVPAGAPVAEVCAVAKRPLQAGETLDAIGENCYRAWTMTVAEARASEALPSGLLVGARVQAPVAIGELLTRANVALPANSRIAELRARQDKLFAGCEPLASPILASGTRS